MSTYLPTKVKKTIDIQSGVIIVLSVLIIALFAVYLYKSHLS